MPTYRLRMLRLREARSGVDVHIEWLEADQADNAVILAKIVVSNFLGASAGVAMLSNDKEHLFWSFRQHLPKPPDPV